MQWRVQYWAWQPLLYNWVVITMIKPVAYLTYSEGIGERVRTVETLTDQWMTLEEAIEYHKDDGMIPLYAIPDGHSITEDKVLNDLIAHAISLELYIENTCGDGKTEKVIREDGELDKSILAAEQMTKAGGVK